MSTKPAPTPKRCSECNRLDADLRFSFSQWLCNRCHNKATNALSALVKKFNGPKEHA